jgi:hypothetical protein
MMVALTLVNPVCAQVSTVLFSTSAPGVSRAITNWGVDTGATTSDDVQRTLIFMGTNAVNMVQVAFTMDEPLTNNDISTNDKPYLTNMVTLASMTSTNARWIMSSGTGAGVNSYYISGTETVYPNLWAATMEAWQREFSLFFTNRHMLMAQPYNEPDYCCWDQGSQQNLYDVIGYLQASTNFAGVYMGGGCTLDCDNAVSWYEAIDSLHPTIGTTHCLGGSVAGYESFIQTVLANNAMPFDPEIHNLGEAIIGANYGLQGGIYWLTVELARGSFANACQGQQLGYAENDGNWTAAAVYRGTNGAVQAFLGGSERMGAPTTFRLFSKDRPVFYNGYGPLNAFTVNFPGTNDTEEVMNISWGADVPPPISGRYIIANRYSGKVMEVPNASTNWGTVLDQNVYTGASNQLWDVYPLAASYGGDLSYYTMTAVHDGTTADDTYVYPSYAFNNGNAIQQYGTGLNTVEHWYLQYAGNGYFYIRNRWSGMCLDVSGPSVSSGAGIVQWSSLNRSSQQWRLIPVGNPVVFVAPQAVTGLTATANAVSIRLSWNTNSGATPVSYTVLQATNGGGPYSIVARGLTNNVFIDNSANQPQTYYYVVEAVDGSLNNSGYSTPASAMPTLGPAIAAHYPFDGTTNDTSGNANNPIVINGSPALVAGKYGSALGLDGTNQYIMLPAGLMAGATNFTIAAWVYWNGGAAWQRIFDFGNGTTQYLFLTPDSGSSTLRFAITTNGSGAEQRIETAPLASNQWVHVAVTCNGSTGCLYTNGVLAASGSISLNPANFNPALNYLGQSQYAADPQFRGALDEVLVANYALSAAQVAWLPFNNAPLPALVHRYSFSETSGTNVGDSIGGSPWNGTLPNGGTFDNGQLALSAASSQYVQLPAGILSNYTAVTIEVWATFPDQIAWNTMLFAFGTTKGTEGNNYIFCAPQGGRIAITSTDYTGEQNAYSGMDFSFHTNLHVTAVFNPPGNYLAIYTNGVLAGVNTAVSTPLNAVSNVFSYLGRSLYSGDTYLDFSLEEFRIYNGVLQAADIAAAQLAGPEVLLTTNVLLNTSTSGSRLTLNWPVAGSGFTLASSPALGSGAEWTPVSVTPNLVGVNYQLTITPTNGTLFFRLQR